MTARPSLLTLGAFVYFENDPATYSALARSVVVALLESAAIPLDSLRMSLFKTPRKQGRYRGFKWKAFDEAIADPALEVLDLVVGTTDDDVWFHVKLQLRSDPNPRLRADGPLQFSFVCETRGDNNAILIEAARRMLTTCARDAQPLFGACFRGPSFLLANCEVDYPANYEQESKDFRDRIYHDQMYASRRWTHARRLYPITLLGPKLAGQLSAADARAAGALAVEEINGSLLLDAYPTVVETWDPGFLQATVEQRRWLWPHTIQNPADAVGLGLKLPRR